MQRDRLDPRFDHGGVMLGLHGIAVKSHGGTDDVGFASALELAIDMAQDRLIDRIKADFAGAFAESLAKQVVNSEAVPNEQESSARAG
jgi:fatty acid/phospholipid biosynthesis enzyme